MLPPTEARPAGLGDRATPRDVERDEVEPPQLQLQPYAPPDLAVNGPVRNAENDSPSFLDWAAFDEATLRPRKNARRSRLDRILSPLKSVSAGLPGVSVEGLGGIIESAHGVFHSVRRLDFMEAERTLYLLPDPGAPALHHRDLERYENELFDLSKYNGACDYLTAMAWTEEALSGSVTLYRVLFGDAGEAVGIRPVAAMRDVPSPVLVRMRTDERIKRKAVVTLIDDDDRTFDWKANPSRGPKYVRLGRSEGAASPLPSPDRSNSRHTGPGLADADGVCATIPQFFALLHSRRSILEHAGSSTISQTRRENGDIKPAVFLTQPPRSSPHDGNRVHVAVLVPNDALWAEEEIIWTDQNGMAEFRQRQYWDLIARGSRRARSKSRARGRSDSRSR
ncbi:hypothetical protein C8A01DRAFT_45572 [Parachaetomium inaequale]|uniref:Uncharacterized protein n=1 Tax=Parachaetomium inaequale TaxID=2588326 RepID=A0AAN6PI85_9PEZI|nr:hypothetical protein C8A01DRAFT_45572 [Parachaetomium inaequale]